MPLSLFRSVLLGVMLCVAALAARAAPIDTVVSQAWFEDVSGQMDWAQVQQQPLTPFSGVLSRGYGSPPIWVKLRIDPAISNTPANKPLYLRIRPSYLDTLTVYDPLQSPARQDPIGDRYPLSAQSTYSTRFTVNLPAGSEPRDIWVRLESTSTRMARFEVFNGSDLAISNGMLDVAGSFYLGLLGLFVVWGVIQMALRPEPLMLCFVIHQATALLFGSNTLGYTRLLLNDLISPLVIDRLTSAIVVLASAIAVLFAHFLLNEISRARWRTWAIGVILFCFAGLLAVLLSGQVMPALEGNMLMILVVPTVLLAMAMASRPTPNAKAQGRLPKPWVVGYFVLTLVFTLFAAAPSLGLIKAPELSLYIVLFYSLSSGLLMITMLLYRAHLHLQFQQIQAAKAWANEQRAEQEKAHRLDRERLLAMMGHELKTPLATLRMLLGNQTIPDTLSRRMDASIQDMASVVDRVVQTGRLEDQANFVRRESCVLEDLLESALRDLPERHRVVIKPLERDDDEATGNARHVNASKTAIETGPGLTEPAGHTASETGSDQTEPSNRTLIETDPDLLVIVLRNLLDNALKYGLADAPVTVRYSNTTHWSVAVENPPGRAGWPDANHVFDKYYRSPKAGHRAGSGLGLYIVQELAHMIGATITYAPDAEKIRFVLQDDGSALAATNTEHNAAPKSA